MTGEDDIAQPRRQEIVRLDGVGLGGGRDELLGEERVATGPLLDAVDDTVDRPPELLGKQPAKVAVEPPEVDALHGREAFELGEVADHGGPAVQLVGPDGDHEEHGARAGSGRGTPGRASTTGSTSGGPRL